MMKGTKVSNTAVIFLSHSILFGLNHGEKYTEIFKDNSSITISLFREDLCLRDTDKPCGRNPKLTYVQKYDQLHIELSKKEISGDYASITIEDVAIPTNDSDVRKILIFMPNKICTQQELIKSHFEEEVTAA